MKVTARECIILTAVIICCLIEVASASNIVHSEANQQHVLELDVIGLRKTVHELEGSAPSLPHGGRNGGNDRALPSRLFILQSLLMPRVLKKLLQG